MWGKINTHKSWKRWEREVSGPSGAETILKHGKNALTLIWENGEFTPFQDRTSEGEGRDGIACAGVSPIM